MNKLRLLLTAAIAVLALAALAGSALASTASISPGGAITASGATTFTTSAFTFSCSSVDLVGSITAGTYSTGSDFGQIDSLTTSGCTSGITMTWLALPWRWRLLQILINPQLGILSGWVTAGVRITFGALTCLYQALWGLLTGVGRGLGWTILPLTWTFVSGSATCPRTLTVNGTYSVSPAQTVSVTP
jgi:hypothetical protein